MKESSLYILLENEESIKNFAQKINLSECEEKFNALIMDAANDYKSFLDKEGGNLKFELLANFTDLFDKCIDIKKHEIVAAAGEEEEEENYDDDEPAL